MRTLLTIAALSLLVVSCQKKQAATSGYNYTCRGYSISPTTGDTSQFFEATYTNQVLTAQQMEDTLDGPNPYNFVICQ